VDHDSPRILLVEDHDLMAQALTLALQSMGFDHVVAAEDLSEEGVLQASKSHRADIVLLDIYLGPRITSIPIIAPLVASGARVMMLTASQDPVQLARCIEAGAIGIFEKSQPFDQLLGFIEDAVTGKTLLEPAARDALLALLRDHRAHEKARALPFESLSAKEQEVLALLTQGKSADDVSAELFVSVATVRTHVRAILRKLGVNSQLAAVVLAQRSGWSADRA
jgi:DNA-binding NarL/FixJ family response regulator